MDSWGYNAGLSCCMLLLCVIWLLPNPQLGIVKTRVPASVGLCVVLYAKGRMAVMKKTEVKN